MAEFIKYDVYDMQEDLEKDVEEYNDAVNKDEPIIIEKKTD
mgnify:CR=1 FL=1